MRSYHIQLPFSILMIIILVLGSLYLFSDSMQLYPAYVHSWTQSDRLAIAMNFQENGFDFFHPATFNLLTKNGITQVDFPIHDYLVAVISTVFKTDLIVTFRSYNLFYALIGLFFLYRASLIATASALRSIFIAIFIGTLPFFVFYQNGFLPSIPSFANFCIGLFFWLRYKDTGISKDFGWAVLFFTLAALARIPFAIALFSLFLYQLVEARKGNLAVGNLVSIVLGILSVALYYFYNQWLANEYGSMFLGKIMNPSSLSDFLSIFSGAYKRWAGQVFSPFHLTTFLLLIGSILLKIAQRKKNKNAQELLIFLFIYFFGAFAYFLLMGMQFIDHDYYYIDGFLPVLCLGLIWLISNIHIRREWYSTAFIFAAISLIGFYSSARNIVELRYSDEYNSRSVYQYKVFKNAQKDLSKWGVRKEDTLAFFDIGSTNIPLTLYKNKGYTSLSSGEESAKELLEKPFDYAFIIDSFKVSDSYFDYPEIANELKYLGSNGELSLYVKSKSKQAEQFFKVLIYEYQTDFESGKYEENIELNAPIIDSPLKDGKILAIDESREFVLTSKAWIPPIAAGQDLRVGVKGSFYPPDSLAATQLAISINDYYFSYFLQSELKSIGQWKEKTFLRRIPAKYVKEGTEIKVYFWNPDKRKLYIDDYQLLLYQ